MAVALQAAPQHRFVVGDRKMVHYKITFTTGDYSNGITFVPTTAGATGNTIPGLIRSIDFGYGSVAGAVATGATVEVVPVSDSDPSQGVLVRLFQGATEATISGTTTLYLTLVGK
jgi:hypothetical protein